MISGSSARNPNGMLPELVCSRRSVTAEATWDNMLQSPALTQVEVLCCDWLLDDLREQKCKRSDRPYESFQPLGKMGVIFKARDRVVKKTEQRSNT